jgi:hypothetical protein
MDIFCDDAVNIAAAGNFIYYLKKENEKNYLFYHYYTIDN